MPVYQCRRRYGIPGNHIGAVPPHDIFVIFNSTVVFCTELVLPFENQGIRIRQIVVTEELLPPIGTCSNPGTVIVSSCYIEQTVIG